MSRKRYITVGELISLLIRYNRRDVVILSKDGEGNAFSPLCSIETGTYHPHSTWEGDIEENPPTEEEKEQGARACIVLWPSN